MTGKKSLKYSVAKKSSFFYISDTTQEYGPKKCFSLSLFSGCGGLDIGVEAAGFHNIACIERDHHAAETLRYNIDRLSKATKVYETDIRNLNPKNICETGVDLLHGGPPCQSFSLIGKRGSLTDERGLLLFEIIRFAKALKPKRILLEQVKGLLSASDEKGVRGGVFKQFIHELEGLGYCVKWAVLCAADYGIPQLRERVFIVALKNTNGFIFPTPTHIENANEMQLFALKPYIGCGIALKNLPPPKRKNMPEIFPNHVDVTPERDCERIHPVPEGSFLACQTHVSKEIRRNLTMKDTTKYRRLHRLKPSLTLRCGEIFFHPTEDRYLTPREYMRIHGYSDEYILKGPIRSRSGTVSSLDQHRQVANSVPPPLGYVVAYNIRKTLR